MAPWRIERARPSTRQAWTAIHTAQPVAVPMVGDAQIAPGPIHRRRRTWWGWCRDNCWEQGGPCVRLPSSCASGDVEWRSRGSVPPSPLLAGYETEMTRQAMRPGMRPQGSLARAASPQALPWAASRPGNNVGQCANIGPLPIVRSGIRPSTSPCPWAWNPGCRMRSWRRSTTNREWEGANDASGWLRSYCDRWRSPGGWLDHPGWWMDRYIVRSSPACWRLRPVRQLHPPIGGCSTWMPCRPENARGRRKKPIWWAPTVPCGRTASRSARSGHSSSICRLPKAVDSGQGRR